MSTTKYMEKDFWLIYLKLFCAVRVAAAEADFHNASCRCLSKWKHAKPFCKQPWTKFPSGIIIARTILHKSTIWWVKQPDLSSIDLDIL